MNKYVCIKFSIFAGDGYGPKNQNRFIAKKRENTIIKKKLSNINLGTLRP